MSHLNVVNIMFLQFLMLFAAATAGIEFAVIMSPPPFIRLFFLTAGLMASTPLLYTIGVVCHWMYVHKRSGVGIVQRLRAWRNGYSLMGIKGSEGLPDRIENSDEYPRENLANF